MEVLLQLASSFTMSENFNDKLVLLLLLSMVRHELTPLLKTLTIYFFNLNYNITKI